MMPAAPTVAANKYVGRSCGPSTPFRQMRHPASRANATVTAMANVSCRSMTRCTVSPCSMVPSARRPDATESTAPAAPATSVQNPAALRESRLVALPTQSKITETSNNAGGRSLIAACHSAAVSKSMSESQLGHRGWSGGIVIKPLAGLLTVHPRQPQALEQRRGRISGLTIIREHDLGDLVRGVQSHEVQQRERAHLIPTTHDHT